MKNEKLFQEKLEWEWKCYMADMLKKSRECLFAEANIITMKKEIYLTLKKSDWTEYELDRFLAMDNMIDCLYLNLDESVRLTGEQIKEFLLEPIPD